MLSANSPSSVSAATIYTVLPIRMTNTNVSSNRSIQQTVELGISLIRDRQFAAALEMLDEGLVRWPNSFWPRHYRAVALEGLGRPIEALETYLQAIALRATAREAADSYHAAHLLLAASGRQEEALDLLLKGARLKPQMAHWWTAARKMARDQNDAEAEGECSAAIKSLEAIKTESPSRSPSATPQILFIPTRRGGSRREYRIDPLRLEPIDPAVRPAPPPEEMEYGETAAVHIDSGRTDSSAMLSILEGCGFEWNSCDRVLEFGCANGRLLRWLMPYADSREIWGVDIQSDKIMWAMENLTPPLNFATTTTVPHLPFPDGHFDLVFAGSIFTHIAELHTSWLLELTRILSARGVMYLTMHDAETVNWLKEHPEIRVGKVLADSLGGRQVLNGEFEFASVAPYGPALLSQVFMSEQYIRTMTGSFLELLGRYPNAYSRLQTAYVFKRRPSRSPL